MARKATKKRQRKPVLKITLDAEFRKKVFAGAARHHIDASAYAKLALSAQLRRDGILPGDDASRG